MAIEEPVQSEKNKACKQCGAELNYKPGSTSLKCDYCGYLEEIIEEKEKSVLELELNKYLSEMGTQAFSEEISMVHCNGCGADQHIEENIKSLNCVFCGNILKLEDQKLENWIFPGAIVPFQLDKQKANAIFSAWTKGLWFAPNNFKKASLNAEHLKGIYTPFWTFDAQMDVQYSGERGEYYYETKTVNVRVNGRNERRTQQVRKTRWYSASGRVNGFIDDTLVVASKKRALQIDSKVSNWNLKAAVPFHTDYLSGYITEKYTVSLDEGHEKSKDKAEDIAYSWAKNAIGGDTQRVHQLQKTMTSETFKHILLPIYMSNYVYEGKKYPFHINGQTGTLSGQRPYSFWKIVLLVLAILMVIGVIFWISNQSS